MRLSRECLFFTLATLAHTVSLPYAKIQQTILNPLDAKSALPSPETITTNPKSTPKRKLHGRFLHITDIHPDPFYKPFSSDERACHRGHSSSVGFYGAETTDCDSPLALLNATFAWIKTHLRDSVDFVIWTGDSARHDNDDAIPRNEGQITEQNQLVVDHLFSALGIPENLDDTDPLNDFVVPIVPTLGNNDVLPHNIFLPGPNRWTTRYLDTWRQFIPEEQRHVFHGGGYFTVDVVPGKLAAISLNTLHFFASNSALDGCADRREPGYEQFEWLRVQLDGLRERGMKGIMVGHVPPARVHSKVSWEESCWQKYALFMNKYRDVVVAGLYGHMNIDHFMLQDWKDVKGHVRRGVGYEEDDDDVEVFGGHDYLGVLGDDVGLLDDVDEGEEEMSVMSAHGYLVSLRDMFATIPVFSINDGVDAAGRKKKKKPDGNPDFGKIGGPFGERYSLSIVGPSVVPNYFPTLRVYSYNISGLEDVSVENIPERQNRLELRSLNNGGFEVDPVDEDDLEEDYLEEGHNPPDGMNPEKKHKTHSKKKHRFTVPSGPAKTAPPGPAYSPQPFSLLSYVQYYANLTHINNYDGKKKKKDKDKDPQPREFAFEVEYDTANDTVYELQDLTVRSWLDLAGRIGAGVNKADYGKEEKHDEELEGLKKGRKKHKGKKKHKKGKKKKKNVWIEFVRRAFVGSLDDLEIEELFGENVW